MNLLLACIGTSEKVIDDPTVTTVHPTIEVYDTGGDTSSDAESTMRDVIYREIDGIQLGAYLYLPAGDGPFPAVVVVHGGGFEGGSPDDGTYRLWSELLVQRGHVVLNIEYRVTGDFPEPPLFPRPLEDVKCAVRWLKHHARQFQIAPERVFAPGGSAGGHLVAMLGVTGDEQGFDTSCGAASNESDSVAGVIDFYGPTQWDLLVKQRETGALTSGEFAYVGSRCEDPEEIAALCFPASVTSHNMPTTSRFLIVHSVDDPLVPVGQSRALTEFLQSRGRAVRLVEVTGLAHAWMENFSDPTVAVARDEVLRWLQP